jgi:hypothetical protein
MTPSGIELATLRFVAQYLYHCATAVSHEIRYCIHFYKKTFGTHQFSENRMNASYFTYGN